MKSLLLTVILFVSMIGSLFAQDVEFLTVEYKGNNYQPGHEISAQRNTQVKIILNHTERGYFYQIQKVRLTFYFKNDKNQVIAGKPVDVPGSAYVQNPVATIFFPENKAVRVDVDVATIKRKNRAGQVFPVWFTESDRKFIFLFE